MTRLKNCPFCGPQEDEGYQVSLRECRDITHAYRIACSVLCPCCGLEIYDEYEDDLVEKWNTRYD